MITLRHQALKLRELRVRPMESRSKGMWQSCVLVKYLNDGVLLRRYYTQSTGLSSHKMNPTNITVWAVHVKSNSLLSEGPVCVIALCRGIMPLTQLYTLDRQCHLTLGPLHATVCAWPSDGVQVPTIELVESRLTSILACMKKPRNSTFTPTKVTT